MHAVWIYASATTAQGAAGAASSTRQPAGTRSRTCLMRTTAQTGTQAPAPTDCRRTRVTLTIEAPDY